MPKLGNLLDFAQFQAQNMVLHSTNPAPAGAVKGQFYFNNVSNTVWYYDGSTWIQLGPAGAGGPPSGAAGGDLTGSYPNPTIGTGKVTSTHILDGTITDTDVALANKDGNAAVPSMRTLGSGATQAIAGNTVLNAITAPTSDLNLNSKRLINVADPTSSTDGATKQYVDNTAQGLDVKPSVVAATTTNITLSGTQTVDGVALTAGNRILVKDQSTPANNGVYIVGVGAWNRSVDLDVWTEFPGSFLFVEQGTVNADTGWVCTSDAGGTLGTTAVTWTQFSGAGTIVDGIGLLKTGNTLDVRLDNVGIEAPSDILQLKDGGVTAAKHGVGSVDVTTNVVTGTMPINKGGTAATTSVGARQSLGAAAAVNILGPPSAGTSWSLQISTLFSGAGYTTAKTQVASVQVYDASTGNLELPDVALGQGTSGEILVTWGASVGINSKYVKVVAV